MKRYYHIALAVVAAFLICGCSKFGLDFSGKIGCNVYYRGSTKAVESNLDSLKRRGFRMTAVIDNDAQNYDTGALIPAGIYFSDADVTFQSSSWNIEGAPTWVAMDTMRFWCWTPDTNLVINPDNEALKGKRILPFHYKLPAGGQKDLSTHAADAKLQHDLLFAYNASYRAKVTSDNNKIDINFYHALTQIRFCVRPTTGTQTSGDGSFKASYKIVDISLTNICRDAHCDMTGTKTAPVFEWSSQDSLTNYTQYYGVNFSDGSNIKLPEGWTSSKDSGNKTVYTASEAFFIIPQTISDAVSLSVTFDNGTKKDTRSMPLKGAGTTKWEAGKYYTYNISISSDINDPAAFSVTLDDWDNTDYPVRF